MLEFSLHPQLEKDTFFIKDLETCRALLMNDARFLWVILVPRIENTIEWHDLELVKQSKAFEEAMNVSKALKHHTECDKINIGAIGNMVPQLHIHIIARFINDDCWPAPVWGSARIEYEDASEIVEELKVLL